MAHGQHPGPARPVLPPVQNKSKFTQRHAGQDTRARGSSHPPKAQRLYRGCRGTGIPGYLPGAQPPCPQPHENGADQLPEGGSVHRVQLVLLAVPQVMVVERASGETHALRGFVII